MQGRVGCLCLQGNGFDQVSGGYRKYFISPADFLARSLRLFIAYWKKILYREAWCFAGKWDRVRVVAVIYAVVHAMKMTEYRVLC